MNITTHKKIFNTYIYIESYSVRFVNFISVLCFDRFIRYYRKKLRNILIILYSNVLYLTESWRNTIQNDANSYPWHFYFSPCGIPVYYGIQSSHENTFEHSKLLRTVAAIILNIFLLFFNKNHLVIALSFFPQLS